MMLLLFVKEREGVEDDRDDDHEEHLAGNKAMFCSRFVMSAQDLPFESDSDPDPFFGIRYFLQGQVPDPDLI